MDVKNIISVKKCYLIRQKSGITYIFSHYFAKIKVGSYISLPLEKISNLHDIHGLRLKIEKILD